MDIDPRDFGDLREIDGEFLEKSNVSWFTRLLLSLSLTWGMGRLAKELGAPCAEMSKKANAIFAKVGRVDIVPSQANLRGFRIVLDNVLSLYFSQDGDHFIYDGFEMGFYEDGDVTVFD